MKPNQRQEFFRRGRMLSSVSALTAALALAATHASAISAAPTSPQLSNINHIVVIYQENWPFDGLYGSFPNADGLANAASENPNSLIQLDKLTLATLSSETGSGTYNDQSNTIVKNNPPCPLNQAASGLDGTFLKNPGSGSYPWTASPITSTSSPLITDPTTGQPLNTLVPYSLPSVTSNAVSPTYITGDIYHRYWSEEQQINGGANNLFVSWSDDPGLVMSHFDATNLPEGLLAQQYTIGDHFFHSAFGGSFLNHQFLIAARAPVYPAALLGANYYSGVSVVDPTTGVLKLYGFDQPLTITINGFTGGTTVTATSTVGMYPGQTLSGTGTNLDGATVNTVTSVTTFTLTASKTATYSGTATVNPKVVASNNASYGKLINDSKITPVGAPAIVSPGTTFDQNYMVNTSYSINLTPNGTNPVLSASVFPSQNDSTPTGDPNNRPYYLNIGDELSKANVSWKWYSGSWDTITAYTWSNPAKASTSTFNTLNASLQIQWHHQPFAYFDNYAPFGTGTVPSNLVGGFAGYQPVTLTPGTTVTQAQNSAAHLQDETHFFQDAASGNLPAVSFIKNVGVNNEHPGYSTLQTGQAYTASLVKAIQNNPTLWAHTAIIITYDEHGGRWDHVAPPSRDIWGPGERVPLIVISPYAKRGYVDHTQYDTSSILKTIENRFNVASLTSADAGVSDLSNCFTSVQIARGGYTYNRHTSPAQFDQVVTLTNAGTSDITTPVNLVLTNLKHTSLINKTGTVPTGTYSGAPYLQAAASLKAGKSVSVTLQFTYPTGGGISYTGLPVSTTNVDNGSLSTY